MSCRSQSVGTAAALPRPRPPPACATCVGRSRVLARRRASRVDGVRAARRKRRGRVECGVDCWRAVGDEDRPPPRPACAIALARARAAWLIAPWKLPRIVNCSGGCVVIDGSSHRHRFAAHVGRRERRAVGDEHDRQIDGRRSDC